VRFSAASLSEDTWYNDRHPCSRPQSSLSGFFHTDSVSLYVDGRFCQTGKLAFAQTQPEKLLVTLGTGAEQRAVCRSRGAWGPP